MKDLSTQRYSSGRVNLTEYEDNQYVGMTWSGHFRISPEAHEKFCQAVFADPIAPPYAHPLMLHIVAHSGKGISFRDFAAAVGSSEDSGMTFGEGRLQYILPLRVDEPYSVTTTITEVARKHGRRGAWDLISCTARVTDDAGTLHGISYESFVVPREEA